MRQFGPFLVVAAIFAVLGGCETKTRTIMGPVVHDTLVVHDTVTVKPPCDDDDGWHRKR